MSKPSTGVGDDDGAPAARFEFDPDTDDVLVAVVEALEELGDLESRSSDVVLNDVIDPDALRQCIHTGGPGTRVSFRFGDYEVTAASRGEVLVAA